VLVYRRSSHFKELVAARIYSDRRRRISVVERGGRRPPRCTRPPKGCGSRAIALNECLSVTPSGKKSVPFSGKPIGAFDG
jgi:hypothetical protein